MKALRYLGSGEVRIEDVPDPVAGPDEAVVAVNVAGLCGTDLLLSSGGYEPARVPITLGHEFVGVVSDVGRGVTGIRRGARVVAEASWRCGTCTGCVHVPRRPCNEPIGLGRTVDGCFAEAAVVPAEALHTMSDGVPDRAAQAFVTVATAARAVELAQREGPRATTVIGTGHAGLLMVQLLARSGPAPIVVGTRPGRLALARESGAAELFDVRDTTSRDLLQRRIDGGGLTPVTIDATGKGEGLGLALGATWASGVVVVYSIYRDPETVPSLDLIYRRELTIVGSRGAGGRWEEASRLLHEGAVNPAALTGDPVPLEAAPALLREVAAKQVAEPRPLIAPG